MNVCNEVKNDIYLGSWTYMKQMNYFDILISLSNTRGSLQPRVSTYHDQQARTYTKNSTSHQRIQLPENEGCEYKRADITR